MPPLQVALCYPPMMQRDKLYFDPFDPTHDDPDVPGPLSRLDSNEVRYIEYFGTYTLSHGSSVTFTPIQSPAIGPPDFWRIFICPGVDGETLTLQEEGRQAIPFPFGFNAPTTQTVAQPQRLTIPGTSRQLTLTATGVGGNGLNFVVAAIWGYDPKDIF